MLRRTRLATATILVMAAVPASAQQTEPPGAGATSAPATAAAADAGAGGPAEPEGVLAALVAEALSANPDLLAALDAAEAARQRPTQAGALADPMLSLLYTNDSWRPTLGAREMTTLGVMASQVLPWPGKRGLRTAVARQDVRLAQERLERARLGVVAGVKRAYWSLVLAQETLALLTARAAVTQDAEAAARARYAVGQGAQQDVLRAQLEVTRAEQERIEQQGEAEVRSAELRRLLGRPPDAPPPPLAPLGLRPRQLDAALLFGEAEARSPELRSAAAAEERERLAGQLARADFRPDFTLQAAYMNRGGLDPMWQAGVGVNLPSSRASRRAALEEAEARRRSATHQYEAVRAQLRYRTEERAAQLRTAESLARLYADGLIPQGRLAYEGAIAGYRAGRVPFLAVQEALASLYGDRLAYLRVLAAHEQALTALEEASLEQTSTMPSGGGADAMALAPATTASGATGTGSPQGSAMAPMGR